MTRLPKTVRDFIKRQATVPIGKVWTCDPKKWRSPYGSCWYKATACMLLSGRVGAKWGGHPNKTELNRLCKEANFSTYWVKGSSNLDNFVYRCRALGFDVSVL